VQASWPENEPDPSVLKLTVPPGPVGVAELVLLTVTVQLVAIPIATVPGEHVTAVAVVARTTVRVKLCDADGVAPLVAAIVIGYAPAVPSAGVPANVAVPSPLSVNVTPLGSAPVSDNAGVGDPVVFTVKLPAESTVNVVLVPDVIAGR
jgi:hypothetical protein